MTDAKHTPGPWAIFSTDPARDGADCWTLKAQPCPGLRGFTRELGILAGPVSDETAQANARLIAAAPEVVAALQELLTAVEFMAPPRDFNTGRGDPNMCWEARVPVGFTDIAHKALAKALGASQ